MSKNRYSHFFSGESMGDGGAPFLEPGIYPRVKVGEMRIGNNPVQKQKMTAFVDLEILEDGTSLGKTPAARAGMRRSLGFPIEGVRFPQYGRTRFRNFVADILGRPDASDEEKTEMAGEAVDEGQPCLDRIVTIDAQPAGDAPEGGEYVTPRATLLEAPAGRAKTASAPAGDAPPSIPDEAPPPSIPDEFPPPGWKQHPANPVYWYKAGMKVPILEADVRALMAQGKA